MTTTKEAREIAGGLANRVELVNYGNGAVRDFPDEDCVAGATALRSLADQLDAARAECAALREALELMRLQFVERRDRDGACRRIDLAVPNGDLRAMINKALSRPTLAADVLRVIEAAREWRRTGALPRTTPEDQMEIAAARKERRAAIAALDGGKEGGR